MVISLPISFDAISLPILCFLSLRTRHSTAGALSILHNMGKNILFLNECSAIAERETHNKKKSKQTRARATQQYVICGNKIKSSRILSVDNKTKQCIFALFHLVMSRTFVAFENKLNTIMIPIHAHHGTTDYTGPPCRCVCFFLSCFCCRSLFSTACCDWFLCCHSIRHSVLHTTCEYATCRLCANMSAALRCTLSSGLIWACKCSWPLS